MVRPAPPADTPILDAADPAALDHAADLLRAGGSVGVPTETVYGLACDASNGAAVAGVYEAKDRPRFNPLIAHVDSPVRADALVVFNPLARALVKRFWPGPLTLVLPRKPDAPVSDLAAAGLDTLAVRQPDCAALQTLIAKLDRPIAAPSANASGAVSPVTAKHVKAGLNGRIHLILDGGRCRVGLESAVVSLIDPDRPILLRPGGLARDAIEAVTGALAAPEAHPIRPDSPGLLLRHYAPRAQLVLNATSATSGGAFLAFGPQPMSDDIEIFNLSPSRDLAEAAANLFIGLRTLDERAELIAVAPIPESGLGEAINDRLRRAACKS